MSENERKELYDLLLALSEAVDERDEHDPIVYTDANVLGPSVNDMDMAAYRVLQFIENLLDERDTKAERQYDVGFDVGHESGYDTGYTDGHGNGREAGYDEGYDEGYKQGLSNGSDLQYHYDHPPK